MIEQPTEIATETIQTKKTKIVNPFSSNIYEDNGHKELARGILFNKQKNLEQKLQKPATVMQESAKEFLKQHKSYTDNEEILPKKETLITATKTENNAVLEKPNFDFITTTDTGLSFKSKTRKRKNFRLKLLTAVYAIVFVLSAGWVIYNTVELTKTNYQIAQYLIKIDQLDNANKAQNGDETFVTSLVQVETRELGQPTEVQVQTNFFDKLCNFFSHLFGG